MPPSPTSGIVGPIRGAARDLFARALNPLWVERQLLAQYPAVSPSLIHDQVAIVWRDIQSVISVMSHNLGEFANISNILQCPPGQRRVRVRLGIETIRLEDSRPYHFTTDVDLQQTGRLVELLGEAVRHAARVALSYGYEWQQVHITSDYLRNRVSFYGFDCY